jgi:hypothetical protein
MSTDFYTSTGNQEDVLEDGMNVGGSTAYRLLRCVEIDPESDSQCWPLPDFLARLEQAVALWGPDRPGYPDEQYVRDYGRGPGYILNFLYDLLEVVERGRDRGHVEVVWV